MCDTSALVYLQVCKLKQSIPYRVIIISSCSWFLSRLVLCVTGRFIGPASTSSPCTSHRPSSAASLIWAPGPSPRVSCCWGRVIPSGPAVKQVIPGTGSRAVHAFSCPAATPPIQWLLAVAPGNTSRSGRWRVTSARSPLLVATSVATAAALAGTRWPGLGRRRWNST